MNTSVFMVSVVALFISMGLMPVLMKVADRVGMIDAPEARKVHAIPVPRVGGIAIVTGAVIAMTLWLPFERITQSYLAGVLVLVVFGIWDDIAQIGHYKKLVGQVIAVLMVILYGDLYVTRLPFFDSTELPKFVAIPFTAIAIIGVINAINHSDGLDGLAGGETLLSLIAIGFLATLAGDTIIVLVVAANFGGVMGFLRFNTYPARVFMGDSGSQVLGFTLAVLVILLVDKVDPALSAALPVLLIGFPMIDIIVVLYLRITEKRNWFRATKNHVHHRLLGLGYEHHESVMIIYSIHAFFVVCAVLLRYDSDLVIMAIYIGVAIGLFAILTLAEKRGWQPERSAKAVPAFRLIRLAREREDIRLLPEKVLTILLIAYVLVTSIVVTRVPRDFEWLGTALIVLALLSLFVVKLNKSILRSIVVYCTAISLLYLEHVYGASTTMYYRFEWVFYSLSAMLVAIAMRVNLVRPFKFTPMDYLVLLVIIGIVVSPESNFLGNRDAAFIIKTIILVYAFEFILGEYRRGRHLIYATVGLGLIILVGRGI